jgi:hypothetical protein
MYITGTGREKTQPSFKEVKRTQSSGRVKVTTTQHLLPRLKWIKMHLTRQYAFTACEVMNIYSFRSPSVFYLLTVGVEVVYFHLITLRHIPQSVGLLWTRDRPVAETYTWQHKQCIRQTSMPPLGFEPTIPASARPQTYALDRAATGIGMNTVPLLNLCLYHYLVGNVYIPIA